MMQTLFGGKLFHIKANLPFWSSVISASCRGNLNKFQHQRYYQGIDNVFNTQETWLKSSNILAALHRLHQSLIQKANILPCHDLRNSGLS